MATQNSKTLRAIVGIVFAIVILWSLKVQLRAENDWYHGADGYNHALAEHTALRKPMLVYFYTDWCPYCRSLTAGVFESKDFRTRYASMVKVKINPEAGSREEALAKQFNIHGYPSLFRIADGEPQRIPYYENVSDLYAAFDGTVDDGGESESSPLTPRVSKAIALFDQGHRTEAEYELRSVVKDQPDAIAYDYLAFIALEKGEWSEALDWSRKLVDADPKYDHGRGYYLRAFAHWHLGDTFEAARDADQGCSMGDKDACDIKAQLQSAQQRASS